MPDRREVKCKKWVVISVVSRRLAVSDQDVKRCLTIRFVRGVTISIYHIRTLGEYYLTGTRKDGNCISPDANARKSKNVKPRVTISDMGKPNSQ